ncbi:MAG: PhzF family phenazine biosynthesis protein [Coriobacteriales bacterium]|jgi:PhzF family phenazine biosynthesis protein
MRQYIVDAFTDKVFAGNPAAVCVMDEWIEDSLMQSIAIENSISETAFAVRGDDGYKLRWFTPGGEIDLCGHATLATAYVISRFYDPGVTSILFETMSGELPVTRDGDRFTLDFPAYDLTPVEVTDDMVKALGARPTEAYLGRDLLCVMPDAQSVVEMDPDLDKAKLLDGLLLNVTAQGSDGVDCISRSFAPKLAVAEDPVCGSGHCHILPYWSKRLGKSNLVAYQASKRGGTIYGHVEGGRCTLAGTAALFSQAEILTD